MSASDRVKLNPAMELFYTQNNTKMIKYDTNIKFKDYKVYSREAVILGLKMCQINWYGYDCKNVW